MRRAFLFLALLRLADPQSTAAVELPRIKSDIVGRNGATFALVAGQTATLYTSRAAPGNYTIAFASIPNTYFTIEWTRFCIAAANRVQVVQSTEEVLLASAAGCSAPPTITTDSGSGFLVTYWVRAVDAHNIRSGAIPDGVVGSVTTTTVDTPTVLVAPCARATSCRACLSVPGCAWCADFGGVCSWSGFSVKSGAGEANALTTTTLTPLDGTCLANWTTTTTCINQTIVPPLNLILSGGVIDAPSASSSNTTTTTTAASSTAQLSSAVLAFDPTKRIPTMTTGNPSRAYLYFGSIGVLLIVMSGIVYFNYHRPRSMNQEKGIGSSPELFAASICALRAVELLALMMLDAIASRNLGDAIPILLAASAQPPALPALTPEQLATATVAGGAVFIPGVGFLLSSEPFLRSIAIFANDAHIICIPMLLLVSMAPKPVSAAEMLTRGVKEASKLAAWLRLVPPLGVGIFFAAITHISRWKFLLTLAAGPLSFDALQALIKSVWARSDGGFLMGTGHPLLASVCLSPVYTTTAEGVSQLSSALFSRFLPLEYLGVSFAFFALVTAYLVEVVSGVSRFDLENVMPVSLHPHLVLGVGAAVVALAPVVESLAGWALLCTGPAVAVTTKALDVQNFIVYTVIPAGTCVAGCGVIMAAQYWQVKIDTGARHALTNSGISLPQTAKDLEGSPVDSPVWVGQPAEVADVDHVGKDTVK